MSSESSQKGTPVTPDVQTQQSRKSSGIGNFLQNLLIYLLEIILPAVLSVGLLYLGLNYVNLWTLDRTPALATFATLLVLLSLLLNSLFNWLINFFRKGKPKKGRAHAWELLTQLIIFILASFIFPLALFAAANTIILPAGGTPMTLYIQYTTPKIKTNPVSMLSESILKSTNPATKIQGIKTLQTLHTSAALDQLFRILNEDHSVLQDAGEYEALSQAIASYGTDAKKGLLEAFTKAEPASSGQSGDFFNYYFSLPVESLRKEIQDQNPDSKISDQKLAQLDAAIANLKSALSGVESGQPYPTQQDFILHTFMGMDIKQDADILAFAHKTIANTTFPDSVRGQALLLVGKLGSNSDLDAIYPFLQSSSDLLQARAMEVIATLTAKASGVKTQ